MTDNKSPETNQGESFQVPENWNYPERNKPHKVVDIDSTKRYLAVRGIDEMPLKIPFQSEYIFDKDGKRVAIKRLFTLKDQRMLGHIRLRGEVDMQYSIGDSDIQTIRFFSRQTFDNLDTIGSNLVNPEDLGGAYYTIGSNAGKLWRIDLGEFADTSKEDQDNTVEGSLAASILSYKFGFKTEDWAIEGGGREDPRYTILYEVEDGFLAVSQTRVKDGMVKVIRAPLRLDNKKIGEVAFANPPYGKDGRGNLNIPWRDIGRVVGASLSYSSPMPKNLPR